MGFPVGYTNLFIPTLLLHVLTFLSLFTTSISTFLHLVGLSHFLETRPDPVPSKTFSVSADFIRELLPVVKYSELIEEAERCMVCLYELEEEDEMRRLGNCKHVFHRCCLDGWLEHDHKTCPLCRRAFVPHDLQHAFNHRMWLASGMSELYSDISSVSN